MNHYSPCSLLPSVVGNFGQRRIDPQRAQRRLINVFPRNTKTPRDRNPGGAKWGSEFATLSFPFADIWRSTWLAVSSPTLFSAALQSSRSHSRTVPRLAAWNLLSEAS